MNRDRSTKNDWTFQWKMTFNPDPNKPATEVIFSRKRKPVNHPALYLKNARVATAPFQKHLGLFLDEKLTFGHHLNEKISKANIGLIRTRLYSYLPRKSLLNIYKSFIRPHLDYDDVIYNQPHNDTFCRMIKSVQYNTALAITDAIKGSSCDRLYQKLGLESLSDRQWYRRLVYFFNIVSCNSPAYLHSMLPAKQRSYDPLRSKLFRNFTSNTNLFLKSFFPYCIREWNKLCPNLQNSTAISIFKKHLLTFIRPNQCSIYNIIDPPGLKLLTRLRVNLSHLRDHKFKHNFLDTLKDILTLFGMFS